MPSSELGHPSTGDIVAICIAVLFTCLLLPLVYAVAYRRKRSAKGYRAPKEVVRNADNYRRYTRYTVLIVLWTAAITAYVTVLDRAANDNEFLGVRGTRKRDINIDILAFLRTAFAIVHLPLIAAVLATTVPYWTMSKTDRAISTEDPSRQTSASDDLDRTTRVAQLFYLADRTWAGALGWISTAIFGRREGGLSYTWAHLALIAAVSYVGFPLLSLAYVTTSSQYWESRVMPATVAVGGLSMPYDDVLASLRDPARFMKTQDVLNTTLDLNGATPANSNLTRFNSSSPVSGLSPGIVNQTRYFPWADNRTLITLSPGTGSNNQLPQGGIRAFASCGFHKYNATSFVRGNDVGVPPVLNFDFDTTDSQNDSALPYVLRCKNDCTGSENSSAMACNAQSSTLSITPFDFKDNSGVDSKTDQPEYQVQFSNVGQTFQGQALSCIQQQYSDYQSVANVQLAIQGPGFMTQVADCILSITYLKPTVNTLIGSYIESTDASSALTVLEANPVTLLNLSMSAFVNFFHQGPPPQTWPSSTNSPKDDCIIPSITNGFAWVSDMLPPCRGPSPSPQSGPALNTSNATTLLAGNPLANYFRGVTPFDERVLLGPLASLIRDPAFFHNGTVPGVAFETELRIAYGRVPALLAVLVLALPVLWTVGLSAVTISQRRWTPQLDAFSMFKLGAGWADPLRDLGLVSLGGAREGLSGIPGSVVVDPQTGVAGLAYPVRRRVLAKEERRAPLLRE